MSADKVRSPEEPVARRAAPRVQLEFHLPTRTRGSETPATDLHSIVARYQRVGALPPSTLQYADVSDVPTSRLEAMEVLDRAKAAFESIPLKVRQAINHDPRGLEAWIVSNPVKARKYGLLAEKPQPKPSSPENPASSGDPGEGKKGKTPKASDQGVDA